MSSAKSLVTWYNFSPWRVLVWKNELGPDLELKIFHLLDHISFSVVSHGRKPGHAVVPLRIDRIEEGRQPGEIFEYMIQQQYPGAQADPRNRR